MTNTTTTMRNGLGHPAGAACRPVPAWGWLLGIVFFPMGVFLVLGFSRALRWWAALLLSIGSYGMLLLFPEGLYLLREERVLVRCYVFIGWILYFLAVGQLQYAIGHRRGLWTARARRIWRCAAYAGLLFLAMEVATTSALIILESTLCYSIKLGLEGT